MRSLQNFTTKQRFWGCMKFPNCRGTRDTDGLSKQDKRRDDAEED